MPRYFQKILPAPKILCEVIPLSATTKGIRLPKECLREVGRMPVKENLSFVSNHAVFIGAGEPVMGHGAVEAVAKGLMYMNPIHHPPWTVNFGSAVDSKSVLGSKPTWTTFHYQNTILGDDHSQLAQMYVHNTDMQNLTHVRDVITRIKRIFNSRTSPIHGYVTPKAPNEAFTERLFNILMRDFCLTTFSLD